MVNNAVIKEAKHLGALRHNVKVLIQTTEVQIYLYYTYSGKNTKIKLVLGTDSTNLLFCESSIQ